MSKIITSSEKISLQADLIKTKSDIEKARLAFIHSVDDFFLKCGWLVHPIAGVHTDRILKVINEFFIRSENSYTMEALVSLIHGHGYFQAPLENILDFARGGYHENS